MTDFKAFDLAIVGGGVNGAGIARDAAGRGLSVLLCEQDDLAQHTSSASTKLIHGGLRYLERGDFGLVRKALVEREVLLRAAPHIVRPLRFVMPLGSSRDETVRPAWMIRAGLFLYDHLAHRELLPASEMVALGSHRAGASLKPGYAKGFAYSDARVDDSRLVVLNALDAGERGATILTRTRCVGAERGAKVWTIALRDTRGGSEQKVAARVVVNAAGPWVAQFLEATLGIAPSHRIRLVKGSHILVRKMFDHDYAYIFQNPDRRVTFAIPYEREFTVIGTTDVDYDGRRDPAEARIDAEEIRYLCAMTNRYFRSEITPADVVHSYSGVRPLLDDDAVDASKVTRDYRLDLNRDGAPLLSVFGGKLTTYRKLAEEAMALISPLVNASVAARRHWTAESPLPGGNLPGANFDAFLTRFQAEHRWLPEAIARRLAQAYGTRARDFLRNANSLRDLGDEVAPGLYERELIYLRDAEFARTGEDILWRRSKLGLHLPESARRAVTDWMEQRA